MEDYRAVERTFQTLVQVAGRAGREENGNVVIQTYNPDHYAIIDSSKQDYDLFYNQEVALRKMLKYPPFCDIILISFSGKNLSQVKNISEFVYKKLISVQNEKINIYKPVPSPIDKIQNNYRWRIIIKCKVTSTVLDIINYAINDDKIKKSKETKIIVDINPNTMN
jgi:primosomal protein N' (replication factor Y)